MGHFLPALTATPLQTTTYLLGIALFSIAFLVFLNSSISFVVTDVIGRTKNVGDAVGSLGFADELLALVACPLWGLLSDRIGVRTVAAVGYLIVGLSLVCLVQSRSVYPDLLLGRLGFSLGGAACSTMVTAVLPAMVAKRTQGKADEAGEGEEARAVSPATEHTDRSRSDSERPSRNGSVFGHVTTPSVSSQLTITPGRYASQSRSRSRAAKTPNAHNSKPADTTSAGSSQLAGFVGMFTGLGALLALAVFLPLPAYFQSHGLAPAPSVQYSFYIVGAIAVVVALFILVGLRNLPGEGHKSLASLFHPNKPATKSSSTSSQTPPTWRALLFTPLKLAATDSTITLAYLGGFVARASSVGISLFIPLFVNAYFVRSGLCKPDLSDPAGLPDLKGSCERAYKLAAALSGIAETAALICAPLFGWLGGKVAGQGKKAGGAEWPLAGAAAVGVLGYVAFGLLSSPDPFASDEDGERQGGSRWALLAVIFIGISQIGAIVCSLGLLSRGINASSSSGAGSNAPPSYESENAETAPLLSSTSSPDTQDSEQDRSQLKGSIAGAYSLAGGAGILLLTKVGGLLFDQWTTGAPFFMLAIFNGLLLAIVLAVGAGRALIRDRLKGEEDGE